MAVAQVPLVSIGFPGTLVNVLPDSKVTAGLDANRPKSERVVNQILIVPIMPNVVQIERVDVAKVSSPTEPYVSMSMNVKNNPISAAHLQLVPIHRAVTTADVSHP
jgi:hypothetical protein